MADLAADVKHAIPRHLLIHRIITDSASALKAHAELFFLLVMSEERQHSVAVFEKASKGANQVADGYFAVADFVLIEARGVLTSLVTALKRPIDA